LTRVLRSSLGGDARTLLLVTVHPAASFIEQSLTSLRFATKARSVDNYIPSISERSEADRIAINDAQRTIEALQEKLRRLEAQPRGIAPGVPEVYRRKVQDRRSPDADALKKELQQLRLELREKERELATKARLLSERDRQLGQLREQLDMATRFPEHRRSHGPDVSGGLPLAGAESWNGPEGLPFNGEEFESAQSTRQTWPLATPLTGRFSGSRAEDIPCLRSSSSFVMRQQVTPAEERGTAICETQEELVEKLVKMAAMQINTSKAQFAGSGLVDQDGQEETTLQHKATESERRIPRRGCPPGPPSKSPGTKNDVHLADAQQGL